MAQPTEDVRWANTTGVNLTEPVSGLKDVGYVTGAVPTAQNHNWLFNAYYKWIEYLKNITSEVLTWTGLQTFNGGAVFNQQTGLLAAEVAGQNGSTFRTGTVDVTGSNYTGAGTGTQHDAAVVVTGGTGGSATGQRALRSIGGASTTGEGGRALQSVGGSGVDGGLGLDATGGASTGASQLGGTGIRGAGGANSTSGRGGLGVDARGADGSVWSGNAVIAQAGDLTAHGVGTTLRNSLRVVGGSCYTSGAKTTLGNTPNVESAMSVLPGKLDDGGGSYSASGITVNENTAAAVAPFVKSQWGVQLGSGYMFKQDPINTTTYPVGTNLTLPRGVNSPWGNLAVCGKVIVNGGSGGTFSVSVHGSSDQLNITSVARSTATRLVVTLSNSFFDANSMYPIVQSNRADKIPFVSSVTVNTITIGFTNGTASVDLDASTDTNIPIIITAFGR